MVSSTEHSKTDEDVTRVDERPARSGCLPNRFGRRAGQARGPLATRGRRSGQPAQAVCPRTGPRTNNGTIQGGRRVAARRGQPGAGDRHAGDQSDAVVEGVRSILDQALQVLEQLGYPRDAQAGVPFDPQRHEVVGVVEHAGQRTRDGCRGAATGLRARLEATAAGGRGGQPTRGVRSGGPRLLRSPRGVAGRDRRSDPAGVPHAGPQVPPGCQQGSSGRRPVQGGQ